MKEEKNLLRLNQNQVIETIQKKLERMKRKEMPEEVVKILDRYDEGTYSEFINNHLDSYEIDSPAIFASSINDIVTKETSLGLLFRDIMELVADKVGVGEVLFSLCVKDAVSGGTDDTDILLRDGRSYEVKKISKGGIFSFSERFTEYNDLGLVMNMAIINFGNLDLFKGKNLYTVSTGEVRSFRMLLEKFLLPNVSGEIPFYRNQSFVKVNGEIKKIENGFLSDDIENLELAEAYYSMFNFRDQVLTSKIKPISMDLFKRGCGGEICTREIINDLFSITALKQILKNVEGVFLVLPDYSVSYFTPHENHDSFYDPREIYLYDISRNKMNFKGPFLKGSRGEKTPGKLPDSFTDL
jgi:hypothetical protein